MDTKESLLRQIQNLKEDITTNVIQKQVIEESSSLLVRAASIMETIQYGVRGSSLASNNLLYYMKNPSGLLRSLDEVNKKFEMQIKDLTSKLESL